MRLPGSKGAVSVAARMLNKRPPSVSDLEPPRVWGVRSPGCDLDVLWPGWFTYTLRGTELTTAATC